MEVEVKKLCRRSFALYRFSGRLTKGSWHKIFLIAGKATLTKNINYEEGIIFYGDLFGCRRSIDRPGRPPPRTNKSTALISSRFSRSG